MIGLLLMSEVAWVKWMEIIWQWGLLFSLLMGLYGDAHVGLSIALMLLLGKWFVMLITKVFHHDG